MNKSYAIFGAGRFGKGLALSLMDLGADVMVIDSDADIIDAIADDVTCAIQVDVLDSNALSNIGLDNIDAVVVAMAQEIEASIMCVMNAKEAGVPLVVAKARDTRMGEILTRIGADQVVYPEKETASRVAKMLSSEDFLDYFELSDTVCVIEIKVKSEWSNKSLKELNLRKTYGANVIAIKEGQGEITAYVDPDKKLSSDCVLVLTINKNDVKKLI